MPGMRTPPPRRPLLRWWVAALALAFVAAVRLAPGSGGGGREDGRARAARAQLEQLRRGAERFRTLTGRLPASLHDLTRDGPEEVYWFETIPPDPWGRPYRLEPSADGDDALLSSAGPDGRAGTGDDLGLTLGPAPAR